MRKIFLLLAVGAVALIPAAVAVAPAGASVAAGSARAIAARPANGITGSDEYAYPDSGDGYTAFNAEGFLETDPSAYSEFDYGAGNIAYKGNTAYCLYQDDSETYDGYPEVDLKTCSITKLSDIWTFGNASNFYSLWENAYSGECAWALGADFPVVIEGCNGNNPGDRWHWTS
jgi:hypothetical protein